MSRNTSSITNFIIFLFAFVLFFRGIINGFIKSNPRSIFLVFLGIWGLGNICAIIAPGTFQTYYYHLAWTPMALAYAIFLSELFSAAKITSLIKYTVAFLFTVIFICRITIVAPTYIELIKQRISLNVFNQPQSFQDPVQLNVNSSNRTGFLKIADEINALIPNKNDTLYIFNFHGAGETGLTPLTYIYAKRYSSTSVLDNVLRVKPLFSKNLSVLRKDLTKQPPNILIVSNEIKLKEWQKKEITPFLKWFDNYIRENYFLKTNLAFKIQYPNEAKNELYNVFFRK